MPEIKEEQLLHFLKRGVSPFHVVETGKKELERQGFCRLSMQDAWKLKAGGKYYIDKASSLFAFRIPQKGAKEAAFRIIASHTDSPSLRIKCHPEVPGSGYAQLNVEVYGSPILNTWMDRPLGIAGRAALKSEDIFHPDMRLVDYQRPVVTIPNLASHFNRKVNEGVAIDRQKDMLPTATMLQSKNSGKRWFLESLAKELSVTAEDILDYELFVYCAEEPAYLGLEEEFLSAPRLDNLVSVAASLFTLAGQDDHSEITAAACFDHEEIGSSSKQGAASFLLRDILKKIKLSSGADENRFLADLYKSIYISADGAHAAHPNKMEKSDPTNKVLLNQGFCIKEASSQTYATDSEAIAVVEQICRNGNIPYQKFVNHSNERGGSTIGAILSRALPVWGVDVGVPMLAMHSAREMMGRKDYDALSRFFADFYRL